MSIELYTSGVVKMTDPVSYFDTVPHTTKKGHTSTKQCRGLRGNEGLGKRATSHRARRAEGHAAPLRAPSWLLDGCSPEGRTGDLSYRSASPRF